MAGIAAMVALVGTLGLFEMLPPPVVGVGLTLVMLGLCALALRLFNAPGTNPLGLKSPEEQRQELESRGLVEVAEFRATRAFGVEEFEDEGPHYYIELIDGRVLFLSGQYLYDFEPITDDPELNQPRRFPCSEFAVLRHKTERYHDSTLRKAVWRSGGVPTDGDIITAVSYDELKRTRLTASAG